MSKIVGIKFTAPVFDGCYDEETELLTDRGWLFFKDLKYTDLICTKTDNNIIEYNKPTQIIKKYWEGKMYKLSLYRGCIDLLVTPDHNMYVQNEFSNRKGKDHGWHFEKPIEVYNKLRYFRKTAIWDKAGPEKIFIVNRSIVTEDWLEFLGYYLSEGSSTVTKEGHYIVQIRQVGGGLPLMAKALSKVTPNKINIRADGRVIVNDKALCLYLKETFGNKYCKHINREILNTCSKEQLSILFEALMLGDGHDNRGKKVSGGSIYNTSSKQLRDDFMELLLKIGYSGSYIKVYDKGSFVKVLNRLCVAKEDHWKIRIKFKSDVCGKVRFSNRKKGQIEEFVDYKGMVYCANVKNHTLFVRRNGAPVWCGNSGYAEAARQYIVALHNKGIPVTVEPVSFEAARPELGETGELLNKLRDKNIPYNVKVIQLTPEHYPIYKEDNVLNVGYSFWETSALHKSWPGYINNNLQLCLVPCEWNKEVYINSGVTIPVRKVKQGIHVSEFENVQALNIAGLAEDTFMFYSIFQWTYRKNPEGLLRAYWASFQNNENVALVLKTYKNNFSATEKEMVRKLVAQCKYLMPTDNPPKVYLLLDLLSRDELLGVHKRGDCFILPHRAEGWGMPHFEAGAIGNPVITTGMSGNMEFTTKENSYLIDYSWTPVSGMPWSLWYAGGQQWWAEPDLKQTSDYMKQVYNNREEAKTRGLLLKNNIHTNFAWGSAVMDMINSIEEAL